MRKSWFTLIEIMIAITVFAIGVLAVLRLLTSNLVTMDRTENRTIATFLAKEWLEMVYNIRDANVQKWLPWNCLLADKITSDINIGTTTDDLSIIKACDWYFSSGANDGHVLSLGFAESGYFFAEHKKIADNFSGNFTAFGLMQMTWTVGESTISRYTPRQKVETWSLQTFGRYILFTGVVEGGKLLPLSDILKVESHVLFSKWSSTGEIVLESLIGKN